MIKLAELLSPWFKQAGIDPVVIEEVADTELHGLKLDSRKVSHGDCFVAVQGHQIDGRLFIRQAIEAGAVAVLQQANSFSVDFSGPVPVICVPQLPTLLSQLGGQFYQHPSQQLALVGVTGTNGKTTVTHLVAQLYQSAGRSAAVLGTLGSGFIGHLLTEKNTTPDALTVQARLAAFAHEGADVVAMEVSSHALVQDRVSALQFSAVVATNISRDHLDYHGSMEAYAEAKADLLHNYPARHRIYNLDDARVREWYRGDAGEIGYTLEGRTGPGTILSATNLTFSEQGAQFTLHWLGDEVTVYSPLVGRFNVSNVLAALAVLVADDTPLDVLAAAVALLRPVAGRMETFTSTDKPMAIVDYAHTPDALEQVLQAARGHCKGRLWCVFGCGGDRDRGKRPQMGQVASQLADVVVVTDDNPRTEEPQRIIDDVISGALGDAEIIRHPGRLQAVLYSLTHAVPEDVIVFAGKGHEDYQIIGTQSIEYDERAVVREYMRESVSELTAEPLPEQIKGGTDD